MKLNRTESPLSRTERNKINENWQVIESKYNDFAEYAEEVVYGVVEEIADNVSDEVYQQIINGSKLEWQEPVDSESGLPSESDEGDTRMVRNTGKVFRFNGNEWQEIQQIDVGPVNELDNRINSQLAQIQEQKADKNTVQFELSLKRDKNKLIGINDFDGETLGYLQDGVGGASINIESTPKDRSVSPIKTDFITVSSNLYNLNNADYNKSLTSDGSTQDHPTNDVTEYIYVRPNEEYTFLGTTRVVFYANDREDSFVSTDANNTPSEPLTVVIPNNARYMRATMRRDMNERINKGNSLLPFEPYFKPVFSDAVDFKENFISTRHTDFIRKGTNLFNTQHTEDDKTFDLSTGVISERQGFTINTEYIRVEPSKEYYIHGFRIIIMYDENKNFLIGREVSTTTKFTTTTSATRYVRFAGPISHKSVMQLSENEVPYETYGDSLKPHIKVATEQTDGVFNKHSRMYKSDVLPEGTPDTYDEIIDMYDQLLNLNVQNGYVVTKHEWGVDPDGNTLVSYSATKPDMDNAFNLKRHKMAFLSGLHGNERGPVVSLYYFLKDLLENKNDNELFNSIHSLVDLHWFPVSNPSGWNLRTRNNSNGVNLNRNFTTHWEQTQDTDKGDGPASENETQIIEQWFDDIQMDTLMDLHTTVAIDNSWFAADHTTEVGMNFIKNYYRTRMELSKWWGDREDIAFPENTVMGYVNEYTYKLAQSWQHANAVGVDAFLVELASRYTPDIAGDGPTTITFGAETIGNLTISALKSKNAI